MALDGNELLYPFFKKWIETEPAAAQGFVKKAIDELGIWMHPRYYHELPIFVPYAVRDPLCRHSGPNRSDEWGAPDARGYFRDDNSLIKGIVSSMPVLSRTIWLRGKKGGGFTASHVWRQPRDFAQTGVLASRVPKLNSFVPNLVWLPKQIAKLTDREGSFAQRYLQKLSRYIYGGVRVKALIRPLIDDVWGLLPEPPGLDEVEMPNKDDIAFFAYKDNIVNQRKEKQIAGVRNACQTILAGGPLPAGKLISARYSEGLPWVAQNALHELAEWLGTYLDALGQTNAEWPNN